MVKNESYRFGNFFAAFEDQGADFNPCFTSRLGNKLKLSSAEKKTRLLLSFNNLVLSIEWIIEEEIGNASKTVTKRFAQVSKCVWHLL